MNYLPKKDVKIVIGDDWNAKVGTNILGWGHVMCRYGYGERNERGQRLLEFASKHDLLITNTRFQQDDSRKWTWITPDGKYTNMTDLVLVENRWKTAERLRRTYQGADISLGHSLVMCKLKLSLKRPYAQIRPEPRRDIEALRSTTVQASFKDAVEQELSIADQLRQQLAADQPNDQQQSS
jgi:hypothetical protein